MFCCGYLQSDLTHTPQDYSIGSEPVMQLAQCQWSNLKQYDQVDFWLIVHWDMGQKFEKYSFQTYYDRITVWELSVKLLLGEWHRTAL